MTARKQATCHYLAISDLPPLSAIIADMPAERRKTLQALVHEEDKRRCAAGWLLMRTILGPRAELVRHGRYGKPFLPGGSYFSLSHSGHYALLAEAPMPVGADVEEILHGEDCSALADLALHPAEKNLFSRRPVPRTFFDIWTLKESYLKLRGTGLNEEPSKFALAFENATPQLPGRPDIYFRVYHQLPGHSAAICLYDCNPPEAIMPLHL